MRHLIATARCLFSQNRQAARPVKNYFPRPIIQGQWEVKPAHDVPAGIARPNNVYDSTSHLLGRAAPMPVKHNADAIQKLRKSAKIASTALAAVEKYAKAGMTCQDLDKFVHDTIVAMGAYPTPIGFMGFPKSVCISVNEVVVHGIPSVRPLYDGDTFNADISIFYDGYHGDNNLMVQIGEVDPDIKKLIQVTQQAVYEAIKICKPGQKFNQIGKAIQNYATENGMYVCDYFNGHGIGQQLHLPPCVHPYCTILSYSDEPRFLAVMEPGNVFTIQPILSMFPINSLVSWQDNFTVVSPNNPSAQFEHTILITQTGCEVLTLRPGETVK